MSKRMINLTSRCIVFLAAAWLGVPAVAADSPTAPTPPAPRPALKALAKPRPQGPLYELPTDAKVLKGVEYARTSGQSLKLDLYLPHDDGAHKPPLLVWIHGGGWRYGDKGDCPLLWLVGKGYAVASINYRLSDVALFPAGVHDCKGAIRWLRAHAGEYGYNATRIGISGGSAGGHLVALLGVSAGIKELEGDVGGNTNQSSAVQAVVDLFGPTDFPNLAAQGHPEFTTSLVALWLGDPISRAKSAARLASPIYHVSPDDAPVLIIQGTKDALVMVEQSTSFDAACRKAGVESRLQMIEGAGHNHNRCLDETRRAIVEEFFAKHVRG